MPRSAKSCWFFLTSHEKYFTQRSYHNVCLLATSRSYIVVKPVAVFDHSLQALRKACCWCAIDNVVIKAKRHTQVFADFYAMINHTWFLGNAAQGDLECMVGKWYSPATSASIHPYRGHHDRAI